MANCTICGEEFVPPDNKTNVCGTCGQILMDEEEAYEEQKRHEGEEMERALNGEIDGRRFY